MWSAVIPNYNGEKTIIPCIEAIYKASLQSSYNGEIIVVDDGSTDNSLLYLHNLLDKINLLELTENKGFSSAANIGFAEAKGDIIILINNDVIVDKDIIDLSLKHFSDNSVFAVSFKAVDENGNMRIGRTLPNFKKGMLRAIPDERRDANSKVNITFFASGGGAAFHREKLLSLGGFDEIFNPFYWEDIDLSYRAWNTGWKIIYEPCCIVLHPSYGTIVASFKKERIDFISRRNQFIFFWKNVDCINFWFFHLFFILLRFLLAILSFDFRFPQILLSAFFKLVRVKQLHYKDYFPKFTTKKILSIFK